MAKLLFAMEEMDTEFEGAEMEVSPEEGEVADVSGEIEAEIADVASDAGAIDSADEAGDQLEEVQDLVAEAGEGEGLDEVAAEAVRIAVEAICARVGADPKKMGMYHLYATENFQSASSRKANTKIAAEGIGSFLKELWAKVKAAVSNLWKKVIAFWDKHISSLGRTLKALESMKKKVAASKGTLKSDGYIEKAPAGLVSAFAGSGDLSLARVKTYIKTHKGVNEQFATLVNNNSSIQSALVGLTQDKAFTYDEIESIKFASKTEPLIGGVFFEHTFEVAEGKVTTTVNSETIDDKDAEASMTVADKAGLKDVIDSTIAVIKQTIKSKSDIVKAGKDFDKSMTTINQEINKIDDSTVAKEIRHAMQGIRNTNTSLLTFSTKLIGLDVRLSKAVLGYTSTCLKQFKD